MVGDELASELQMFFRLVLNAIVLLNRNNRGSFGILTSIILTILLIIVGIAVDVSSAPRRRIDIQVADAAIPSAAARHDKAKDATDMKPLIEKTLYGNAGTEMKLLPGPTITRTGEICISVESSIPHHLSPD